MSDKTGKMILIKDGVNIDIFDDKNMSDKVLMLDYPEGTNMEQLHKFYKLIGKECEIVEAVHPKRLYTLTEEQYPVMMLVDEEYLYHETAQVNPIASYLYETDVHGHPIRKCSDYRNEKRIRWNGILRNECRASRRIT